jgi:hypothetical protein
VKLQSNLLKQGKVRLWMGGIKHSMGQIGIYVSFINLILLIITSYNTGWVQRYFVGLNFFQFTGIIIGLILMALLFEFKVDMPNYFGFWNQQFWRHDNPLRQNLEAMNRKIDELKEEIEKLKDENSALLH